MEWDRRSLSCATFYHNKRSSQMYFIWFQSPTHTCGGKPGGAKASSTKLTGSSIYMFCMQGLRRRSSIDKSHLSKKQTFGATTAEYTERQSRTDLLLVLYIVGHKVHVHVRDEFNIGRFHVWVSV